MDVHRHLQGQQLREGINVTETTRQWVVNVVYQGYVTRITLPRDRLGRPMYRQEKITDLHPEEQP